METYLHPFHFLLLTLPFIAVFCIEELDFFSTFALGLFSNSLRDKISMIQCYQLGLRGSHQCQSSHICLLKSTFLCQKTPYNFFFSLFNPYLALLR